jgi:molybdopterin-guanine dinucleotide biosynthesis protein A
MKNQPPGIGNQPAHMTQVDALILAGGTPKPDEPLYAYTQGKPKALLKLAGRPMVQWVVEALDNAATIRRIVISGLTGAEISWLVRKPLAFVPDRGSMLGNAQAGLAELAREGPLAKYVLLVSSDIPTITPEIVDWNVTTSLQTEHEGYYSLIPREKMEARFPGSRRSYFHFKDGIFTGGDMNLIAASLLTAGHPMAPAIIKTRKNIFRQAALVGFDVLFLFAMRRLTVADAERLISQRLQIRGRALICPCPEAGMDVDKPAQYELVKRDLEAKLQKGAV